MRENGVATLVGPKCTLSLGGPLIIYPYWTQFTLKLTGSRLVSLAKLTSKLTIYDRARSRVTRLLAHSFVLSFRSIRLDSFLASTRQPWPTLNPSKFHRVRDRGSLRQEIRLLNRDAINRYCVKRIILNYNVLYDFSSISYRNDQVSETFAKL